MNSLPWRRSSAPRVTVPLEFSPARGRSVFTVAALSLVSGLPLTLSAACSMADPFTYADTPARECSAREAPDPSRSEWPSATRYARHLEAYYDAISPAYDDWSSGVHRRLAARLVEIVSPLPGERVLDVGCGSGLVAQMAADRVGVSGEVIGIDIAHRLLEVAQSRASPDV